MVRSPDTAKRQTTNLNNQDHLEAAKELALRLYYEVDARIQNKLPATTRGIIDGIRLPEVEGLS